MSHWGQEQEILPLELIAFWKLDETEGIIAQNRVSDKDGTLHGNPVWQPVGGKINGALQFDGVDDYVSTPNYTFNPATYEAFSVFAWVKGGAPGQVIISQKGTANWLLADSSGKLITELKAAGTSGQTLVSQAIITDGDWHRIGFVWKDFKRILFVDDVEVARDANNQSNFAASNGGLYIGAGKNLEPGTFFSGLIDDVRIYNRAMTP
jgi:hypothetical protein